MSFLQGVLTSALLRMAQDHPYHCLYPLIALSNGDTEGDPGARTTHMRHETNIGRVSLRLALHHDHGCTASNELQSNT